MPTAVIFPLVSPPFAPKGALKPFAKVENREVFLRCVELYTPRDHIAQKLLICTPDDLETIQQKYSAHLGFQGVSVSTGGSTWFSCVARALEKLNPEIDTVLIHDPCCPAVPYTLLDALDDAISSAPPTVGGVVPTLPTRTAFADIEGSGGSKHLKEFVDMSAVVTVQSPQIFRRPALTEAYAKRTADIAPMDDAELLLLTTPHKILTLPGSRYNERIDSEETLKLARDFISHMPKPKSKTPLTPFDEAQW
jgi:2-C-methyl-D-erythritol 4-phosphate cytidylyltransferase